MTSSNRKPKRPSRTRSRSEAPRPTRRTTDRAQCRGGKRDDVVVGLHAVAEVLVQRPEAVLQLWTQSGRQDTRMLDLLAQAAAAGISCQAVPRETLDRLADGARHQGVVARCRPAPAPDFADLLEQLTATPADVLVLDGVSDPHNLGACLRSAAAAGVIATIVPRSRSAPVSATVRKVACGGAERVRVYAVANLTRALQQLRSTNMRILGLDGEANASIYDAATVEPVVLVVGVEDTGLRRLTREHCDELVQIPMAGSMESLNMSVATGIALFELQRQRLPGA